MPLKKRGTARNTAVRPVGFRNLLEHCMEQIDVYAEVCNAPKYTVSRSWWVIALARALSEEGLEVRTEPDLHLAFAHFWGEKLAIPDPAKLALANIVAWPKWSRHLHDSDEYGRDEKELPPVYLVRLVLDHIPTINKQPYAEMWKELALLANCVRGPVTVSLVVINRISGLDAWSVAQNFEFASEKVGAECEVSTQLVETIGTSIFDPLERFQLLLASRRWHRKEISNPEFRRILRRPR